MQNMQEGDNSFLFRVLHFDTVTYCFKSVKNDKFINLDEATKNQDGGKIGL